MPDPIDTFLQGAKEKDKEQDETPLAPEATPAPQPLNPTNLLLETLKAPGRKRAAQIKPAMDWLGKVGGVDVEEWVGGKVTGFSERRQAARQEKEQEEAARAARAEEYSWEELANREADLHERLGVFVTGLPEAAEAERLKKLERERSAIPYNPMPVPPKVRSRWLEANEDLMTASLTLTESPTLGGARTMQQKREAIVEFGDAYLKLMADPEFKRYGLKYGSPSSMEGLEDVYGHKWHNLSLESSMEQFEKWIQTKEVADPVEEEAAWLKRFNKDYRTSAKSRTEAERYVNELQKSADRKMSVRNKAQNKKIASANAYGFVARGLSWPHHLQKLGEVTGAVAGELTEQASLALGEVTGLFEGGKHRGEYLSAMLASPGYNLGPSMHDILRSRGVKGFSFGAFEIGEIAPELGLAAFLGPAARPLLVNARLATSGPAARYFMQSAAGKKLLAEQAASLSFGGVMGGKQYGLTVDPQAALNVGLMGAFIVPVHRLGKEAAGRVFSKVLSKSPTKASLHANKLKVAEELAGLGSVMAIVEGPHFVEAWRGADAEERKTLLLETVGKLFMFSLPAVSGAFREGPSATAERISAERASSPEGKARLAKEQQKNMLLEFIRNTPEAYKGIEKALNDSLGSHKPLSKADAKKYMEKAINDIVVAPKELPPEMAKKVEELTSKLGDFPTPVARGEPVITKGGQPKELGEAMRRFEAEETAAVEAEKTIREDAAKLREEILGEVRPEDKAPMTREEWGKAERAKEAAENTERQVEEYHKRFAEWNAEGQDPATKPLDPLDLELKRIEKKLEEEGVFEPKEGEAAPEALEVDPEAPSLRLLKKDFDAEVAEGALTVKGDIATDAVSGDRFRVTPAKGGEVELQQLREKAPEAAPEVAPPEAPKPAEGEGEPVVGKDWRDTHELTGEKRLRIGKATYDMMLKDGEVKDLGDGSYEIYGKRYIKELDEGGQFWRTTEIVPKPAEGAAKAVRDEAKIEEAATEAQEAAKEKPIEEKPVEEPTVEEPLAEEPPPPPPPPTVLEEGIPESGRGANIRATIEAEIDFLKERDGPGDKEMALDLALHPESYYRTLPASRLNEIVRKMPIAEVEQLLMDAKEGGPATHIETLLQIARVENRYDRVQSEMESGNTKALEKAKTDYTDVLQKLAEQETLMGRLIQQMRYFRKSPEMLADILDATLRKAGKEPLTPEARESFVELTRKTTEAEKFAEFLEVEANKNPTESSVNAALKAKAEAATFADKRMAFLAEVNPMRFRDLIVAHLQGNYLTPDSLGRSFFGNVVPIPIRALTRTVARGVDLTIGEFLQRGKIRAKLDLMEHQLKGMDEGNPARKALLADIFRLRKRFDPAEGFKLAPIGGTGAKLRGFAHGTGIPRLIEAFRLGGKFKDRFKDRVADDAASSLMFGSRLHEYEAGMDPTSGMRPINAWDAAKRVKGRAVAGEWVEFAKDLAEATIGIPSTLYFKALGATDLPFRHGEYYRIIREYGLSRTKLVEDSATGKKVRVPNPMSKAEIRLAQKMPTAFFDAPTVKRMWNEASRATFQNESAATAAVGQFNRWWNTGRLGAASYTVFRGAYMPYQRTLINVTGELAGYTPLGFIDAGYKGETAGWNSREFKYSLARAITGTGAYFTVAQLIPRGIISEDMDPFMASDDTAPTVRFGTEMAFPHGNLNYSGLYRWAMGGDPKWKAGDWTGDMRRGGPFGRLLLANASLQFRLEKLPPEERAKIEGSMLRTAWAHTKGLSTYTAASAVNQSFATGFRDLVLGLANLQRNQREGQPYQVLRPLAKALPTAILPNTMDWFYKRNSKYKQNFKPDSFYDELKTVWNRRLSVLGLGPGVDDIPPIVDMWGSPLPQRKGKGSGSLTERFLLSSFSVGGMFGGGPRKTGGDYDAAGQWLSDPASSEVYRLWRKYRKNEIWPSIPSRTMRVDGKLYKLNKQQYYEFSTLRGQYALDGGWSGVKATGLDSYEDNHVAGVYDLVSSEGWDKTPDDRKLKLILESKRLTSAQAKKAFLAANLVPLEEIKDPSGDEWKLAD